MKILDITKLTGFLVCYMSKAEMETVHARLKDLKEKEPEMKDVAISSWGIYIMLRFLSQNAMSTGYQQFVDNLRKTGLMLPKQAPSAYS